MRLNVLALLFLLSSCDAPPPLTRFVDPLMGTGSHGHVYPGATVPFGMVQLSPDNGDEGWDWCAGYHYSSNTIAGFSHTHLSGTGIGDWCDISVLPLTNLDSAQNEKIKIPFSHSKETARPGYYAVLLNNQVNCELTASERSGFHRYTFPGDTGWLRFDMGFRINWDQSTDGMLQMRDEHTLLGYRYSTGWAKGQKVYFAARFNSPVQKHLFLDDSVQMGSEARGNKVKVLLQFATSKPIDLVVSLSSVSTDKALDELNRTLAGKTDFETVSANAQALWEKELQKIRISTSDPELARKFYTSFYRTCMAPVIYSDADGAYQTHDNRQMQFSKGKNKYTIFSQWDVFRALNPLFTITQPERVPDMINSMLQFYEDNGLLPVWDISTWEANTMTGYHSVAIIADAMLKGIKGFDYEKAYEAMRKSAFQNERGTPEYIRYGYVPQDKHGWSVTITLEYAFDDWCIAQVAKLLGKMADYDLFMKRAMSYKHLFDAQTGFMRGKDSKGHFIEPFDPLLSEHGFDGQYIEGTAWQHSFFVPHDLDGFADLFGGKEKLVQKLDQLFTAPSVLRGENVSMDVTGLIGQYAHGNEPSHHIIYMYTALGYPEKAAHWLKIVADSMYNTGPDGLIGNDDCGQMSAWYVWTSLGLYPMNPASGEYIFGVPFIDQATIELPNQRLLEIAVEPASGTGTGIAAVEWNGNKIPVRSISHQELLKGGKLRFFVYQ
ncbi:MAG: GH92 family glycosyl hydrolase [Chitinophagaceae bacterium]